MITVEHLLSYLKQERQKGVTHVPLDQPARDAVRTAIRSLKKSTSQPTRSTLSQATDRKAPPRSTRTEPTSHHIPLPASAVKLSFPEGSSEQKISYLKEQASHWMPATSLGSLRERLVFSTGSAQSKVVFIGEAPGYEEELQGEPFVGKAGQKFNQILKAMSLSREDIYLTNTCKFRPSLASQTTNNRKPTVQEIAACLPLLQKELEVIQPKCIVALGATAAEGLLNVKEPISKLRNSWHQYEGSEGNIPVRVTYHPSYLLRNEDNPAEKRKVWEDMLAVMEHLELTISEKQRGYFQQ